MNNKKFCSFYISEFHLLTILMPYINEKVSENKKIELILEEDMIHSLQTYLKTIEIDNKDKILKMNWRKNKNEKSELNSEITIIIGSKEYIEKYNLELCKNVEEIVNCYNLENIEEFESILQSHDFILNTKGECSIQKNSQNAQKRKTIKSQS